MGNHEPTTDLAAICKEVGHMLYDNNHHHSCIFGSALLTNVLYRLGYFDAYPLTVGVRIHNRLFRKWVDAHGFPKDEASAAACDAAGGLDIIVGKGAEGFISADRWAGHLAVVIPNHFGDRHALCDLTIGQANRADWEVDLPPMCLRVSDDFVAGRRPFKTEVKECWIIYEAFPEDHSYSKGNDWLAMEGLDEATSNVAVIKLNRKSESRLVRGKLLLGCGSQGSGAVGRS